MIGLLLALSPVLAQDAGLSEGQLLKAAGGPAGSRAIQSWENDHIRIYFRDEGATEEFRYRFTMHWKSGTGDKNMLSGDGYPWSAWTAVDVDGTVEVFGIDGTDVPVAEPSGGFRATHYVGPAGDIRVTQRIVATEGLDTGDVNAAYLLYEIRNEGFSEHDVAVRVMLDPQLHNTETMDIVIPGDGTYTNQTEWLGPNVPESYEPTDSGQGWNTVGRLTGIGTLPSRFVIADWVTVDDLYRYTGEYWNYTVPTLPTSPADTAVLVYWDSQTLESGWSWVVGTSYGLEIPAELPPGYMVIEFTGAERAAVDDMFVISATVTNTSDEFDTPDADAELMLPPELELWDPMAEPLTKQLGYLPMGASTSVSWEVKGTVTGYWEYCLRVVPHNLNIPDNLACAVFEVYPAVPPTATPTTPPPYVPTTGQAGLLLLGAAMTALIGLGAGRRVGMKNRSSRAGKAREEESQR